MSDAARTNLANGPGSVVVGKSWAIRRISVIQVERLIVGVGIAWQWFVCVLLAVGNICVMYASILLSIRDDWNWGSGYNGISSSSWFLIFITFVTPLWVLESLILTSTFSGNASHPSNTLTPDTSKEFKKGAGCIGMLVSLRRTPKCWYWCCCTLLYTWSRSAGFVRLQCSGKPLPRTSSEYRRLLRQSFIVGFIVGWWTYCDATRLLRRSFIIGLIVGWIVGWWACCDATPPVFSIRWEKSTISLVARVIANGLGSVVVGKSWAAVPVFVEYWKFKSNDWSWGSVQFGNGLSAFCFAVGSVARNGCVFAFAMLLTWIVAAVSLSWDISVGICYRNACDIFWRHLSGPRAVHCPPSFFKNCPIFWITLRISFMISVFSKRLAWKYLKRFVAITSINMKQRRRLDE